MDIIVGDWFVSKNNRSHFPVLIMDVFEEENIKKVFFLDTMYAQYGELVQQVDSFEKYYKKYEGDFSEFDSNEMAKALTLNSSMLIKKIKCLESVKEKLDEEYNEISNLKRENKILKVLAECNRQNLWVKGEVIPSRVSECRDCGAMLISETSLPFFQERPERDTDSYYCGCYGWD